MKYSLKNKEFSRKKHSIFDNNPRRSRTKSTSLTPRKSIQNLSDNIQKQFKIHIKPPSLNHSTVDKLNSLQIQGNSIRIQKNEQEQSIMFQSFSRVENYQFKKSQNATNINVIKPSEPIKFVLPSKTNSELRQKNVSEYSEPRSESFQVCEDDNFSRVNRFFTESILVKESQSPMNKVVFEPVVRKSVSPEPKSLSPDTKLHQQLNRLTPINLKIQPGVKVSHQYTPQNQPLVQRKVSILQIPREIVKIESHNNVQPQSNPSQNLHQPSHDFISQNRHSAQQITELRRKVQEQNLQIQYLKNQKQIIESNIELKFSPKKVSYELPVIENQTLQRTPEKYGIPQSRPAVFEQQLERNKLIELSQTNNKNQQKIFFLYINLKYFQFILQKKSHDSIFKCQDLLIKMFSEKYYSFTEQLNAKMFLIDQKSTQVLSLDHKIDVFTNTFRSIDESLRITKLKQQNIQLLIKNKQKRSDRFWNKQENSRLMLMENQSDISSIRIFNDNQLEEKDREELKRLEKNIKEKGSTSQWTSNKPQDFFQFDSFLDQKYSHLVYNPKKQHKNPHLIQDKQNQKNKKQQNFKKKQKSPKKQFMASQIYEDSDQKIYNHNKSTTEEIQQFSPFQANQMFINQKRKISSANGNFIKYCEKTPGYDFISSNAKRQSLNQQSEYNRINLSFDDASSKNYDFSQNFFEIEMNYKETPRNLLEKQISFVSQNMFRKNLNKTNSQNDDISDTLQGQQERLVKILKSKNYQFPIECWLDEMGCLRKKNQTYIFDDQGSVIMTTPAAFKKLKEKRFLI